MKYAWIRAHRMEFSMESMCLVLEVGKRGFNALYASLTETPKLFAAIYDRYVYDIADEELNF